jgi:membrane protease YdiL (CAAX protease family)
MPSEHPGSDAGRVRGLIDPQGSLASGSGGGPGCADAAGTSGAVPFCPPALATTVVFLVAAALAWYGWRFDRRPWLRDLQPLFVLAGMALYFGSLRLFAGLRWRDVSRDGRFVLLSSWGLFSLLWWFGRTGTYDRHLRGLLPESSLSPLYGFFYFALCCFVARTVLPWMLLRIRLRRRAAEFGFRFRGTFELWWVYLVLTLLVVAVVWFYASAQPAFQARYPMARRILHGDSVLLWQFAVYQAAYGLIFVSGESFWRGYLSFGLERDLGWNGIVYMIIPYSMAHYGKPLAEALAAIPAGLVLGYLVLRHRSFWLGVAAHWAIALAMDLSALARAGIAIEF